MSLQWQTLQLPLSAGLQTKGDKRAQNPPALDAALDCEFDDLGGLRTRKPYANLGLNLLGGGTVSDVRRLAVGPTGELLLFTKDTLYTWDAGASAWTSRGTHLAIKTREASAFAGTDDRQNCDMAELGGVTFYAWEAASVVYLAAADATTGAVVFPATAVNGAFSATVPRLVALSTRVLCLFIDQLGQLSAISINPASISIGAATVINGSAEGHYDAERIPGADTAIVASTTAGVFTYLLSTVTAGLTVTSSAKSRTVTGALAVACTPDGAHAQLIRRNGNDLAGDYLAISGLTDVSVNQVITTGNASSSTHIAAAYRSVQVGGTYRCHVFWSVIEYNTFAQPPGQTWSCTVDANGTIGTGASMASGVAPCSRAFDVAGRVFVNLAFGEASFFGVNGGLSIQTIGLLQNTYFLHRDDGFLAAKSVANLAGGYAGTALPGVTLRVTGAYAWCGSRRRTLPLGGDAIHGYSGRSPVRIEYTIDSNEARRCAALGRTLYIAGGGELLQYDGAHLTEVGFHLPPWNVEVDESGTAGNPAAGTYGYKMYWRWDNAQGERERSTTTTAGEITLAGGKKVNVFARCAPNCSHKTGPSYPAAELWRTAVNPTADAPLYLATSTDPSIGNPNGYFSGDPASQNISQIDDNYADATLTTKELDPESGGTLESLAPPAATLITAGYDRLFIAGIPSSDCAIWYSKTRDDGAIAAFNDALIVNMPPDGGAITGLQWLNETLIVFKETAVFALPGDGFDNLGGGSNMGPARVLSSDVGAESQEAIARTPDGLIFKSAKGWYLLDRGWEMHYIGAPVAAYDGEAVEAMQLTPAQQQVRITTSSRVLVWDYFVNQWAEWSIAGGLGAAVWAGTYCYVTSAGVFQEQASYATASYGIDVESAWIKLADLQGFARIRRVMLLGEYRADCNVRIRIARDYESDGAGSWAWFDDVTWAATPAIVGGPLQVRHGPSRQQCEAIKVRITVTPSSAGESIKLTGLAMEVGTKPGLFRRLPATQKA